MSKAFGPRHVGPFGHQRCRVASGYRPACQGLAVANSSSVPSGIYRFSSIARPVDPRFPTNRALLILLPLLALVSGSLTVLPALDMGFLPLALGALLTCFVAWALTRELAPDDNVAAFVALTLAWLAFLLFGTNSVLLTFVALVLVRIVNRSTGLPARLFDTLSVLGLCTFAAISLDQNLIMLVAAAAFLLNATLPEPQRMHFVPAALCLSGFAWLVIDGMPFSGGSLQVRDWLIVIALAAGTGWVITQIRTPVSVCDVYSKRLEPARVKAGLLLGFALALQALLTDGSSAWLATPIWACIISVPASLFARRFLPDA